VPATRSIFSFNPPLLDEKQVSTLGSSTFRQLARKNPSFSPENVDPQVMTLESSDSTTATYQSFLSAPELSPVADASPARGNSQQFLLETLSKNILSSPEFSRVAVPSPARDNSQQFLPETTPKNIFKALLELFPEITKDFNIKSSIKHNIVHRIPTVGDPIKTECSKLESNHLIILGRHLSKLQDDGIIEHTVRTPWSSALHVAPEPDGFLRVHPDYSALNAVTASDTFPIPTVKNYEHYAQEFNHRSRKTKIFSKMNVKKNTP